MMRKASELQPGDVIIVECENGRTKGRVTSIVDPHKAGHADLSIPTSDLVVNLTMARSVVMDDSRWPVRLVALRFAHDHEFAVSVVSR